MSEPLLRCLGYVGVGGLLILAILYCPKRIKLYVGRIFPPNWMSVAHAPIAWIGYFWLFHSEGQYFWAILLLSLSGGLDLADGRVARAHDELVGTKLKNLRFWTQMNHPGTTPLGKTLDPLADKLTVTPLFLAACWTFFRKTEEIRNDGMLWLFYFGVSLIILMLLMDLCGQLIRLDYFKRWRRKKDTSATDVGKYKALGQWLWLLFYAIWERGWLPEATEYYLVFLNVMLVAILVLAALSVISKIRPIKALLSTNL
jgi:phosphatidylglycerophosphate synthase